MRYLDAVKGIRHEEVSVLKTGHMEVYYSMSSYYLLLFVIYVLSLDNLADLLMHFSLSVMCYISPEFLYIYQTIGFNIVESPSD